jgi:hypothetical protein
MVQILLVFKNCTKSTSKPAGFEKCRSEVRKMMRQKGIEELNRRFCVRLSSIYFLLLSFVVVWNLESIH